MTRRPRRCAREPAALVITGGGDKAFVSGGDLKELARYVPSWKPPPMAWRMRTICDRIAGFPGPVVAALNGHALGGGAEFAVAADIRIAADDIKIGFNQVSAGNHARLGRGRTIGRAGRPQWRRCSWPAPAGCSTAAEAYRVGLLDEVVPRAEFAAHWRTTAKLLARRPGGEIKRVINGATTTDAVAAFARLWVSDEHWDAADKVLNKGKVAPAVARCPVVAHIFGLGVSQLAIQSLVSPIPESGRCHPNPVPPAARARPSRPRLREFHDLDDGSPGGRLGIGEAHSPSSPRTAPPASRPPRSRPWWHRNRPSSRPVGGIRRPARGNRGIR